MDTDHVGLQKIRKNLQHDAGKRASKQQDGPEEAGLFC
jgi:hypothetical protein